MKRFFFLTVAATALFAACNKTEVVYNNNPQEIAFNAVNKTAVKAPVDGVDFPTDDNMQVAAYLAQGDAGAGQITSGNYFAATLFDYAGEFWKGSRYWPLSESIINFLAISQPDPASPVATEFNSTTPAAKAIVTLADNSTAQYDLMYAAGQGHCKPGDYPDVDMVFKHALSWIYFTVKTNVTGTGKITVNSITLNDAVYNGELTLTNNSYNVTSSYTSAAADVDADWTSVGTEQDVQVVSGAVTCGTSALDFGNGLLVLPGNQTSFTINYTITHDAGVTNTLTYTYTLGGKWAMAKKYIYNITLNLNEILIDPVVADWADVPSDVTIE